MLALAGLELEALDVVDIGESGQHDTHIALRPAVRVIIDADPESVALDRGELAFEADALAGKRGFEISVIKLVEVAAVDFADFAADDFGLGAAGPIEEGRVDETNGVVPRDCRDRQAEPVQLSPLKRQQGFPFDSLAHGL